MKHVLKLGHTGANGPRSHRTQHSYMTSRVANHRVSHLRDNRGIALEAERSDEEEEEQVRELD